MISEEPSMSAVLAMFCKEVNWRSGANIESEVRRQCSQCQLNLCRNCGVQ